MGFGMYLKNYKVDISPIIIIVILIIIIGSLLSWIDLNELWCFIFTALFPPLSLQQRWYLSASLWVPCGLSKELIYTWEVSLPCCNAKDVTINRTFFNYKHFFCCLGTLMSGLSILFCLSLVNLFIGARFIFQVKKMHLSVSAWSLIYWSILFCSCCCPLVFTGSYMYTRMCHLFLKSLSIQEVSRSNTDMQ